jgi:hypothetical protein
MVQHHAGPVLSVFFVTSTLSWPLRHHPDDVNLMTAMSHQLEGHSPES